MRSHAPPHAKNDTLRSVRRALDVLDLLAVHSEGLPIKRIACDLGLNISTCYHLLNTLMASGYVQRDAETSLLHLGLKVASLSNALALRVSDRPEWKPLRPLLYDLTAVTHAASYLAVWQDGDTVIQSIVEGPHAEKVPELYVGFRGGSHMHALGRALLSAGGHETLAQYVQHPGIAAKLQQRAFNLDALRRILDDTRTRGFSLDLEEFKPGICCIGAPVVLNQSSTYPPVLVSIAVSLPADHYALHARTVVREVLRTSREAAARLANAASMPVISRVGSSS